MKEKEKAGKLEQYLKKHPVPVVRGAMQCGSPKCLLTGERTGVACPAQSCALHSWAAGCSDCHLHCCEQSGCCSAVLCCSLR